MTRQHVAIWIASVVMAFSTSYTVVAAGAVDQSPREVSGTVRSILWRAPGAIATKDLSWSNDPEHQPPKPPFKFVEEDTAGTRPKVIVVDADGSRWNVKLSGSKEDTGEVHSEVAAVRLTWALGYLVEEVHYVAEGRIEGAHALKRADESIGPDGRFKIARFEKRPAHIVRTEKRWTFDDNPFVGTKELSGLMILMTMFNNWDLKGTQNTIVLDVPNENGAHDHWYLISDHGAAFGRMSKGGLFARKSRWDVDGYREQDFLDGKRGNLLYLHYRGEAAINAVPLDYARWFAALIAQLTPQQVRQAFEAAGATEAEVAGFSTKFLDKIKELQAAVTSVNGQ